MSIPATVPGALVIQYQDGVGMWRNFGDAADLGSLTRTRRFAPGPRMSQIASKWRVVKIGDHDWDDGVATLQAIRFWKETAELSPVRIKSFAFDDQEQRYFLVRTDRNMEVYRADTRIASIPTPHVASMVTLVRPAQVLDTMIQFHASAAPQRITRQGSHNQWDSRDLVFDAIPLFDYTGERTGGVDEVQQLQFKTYAFGDTFNITLEGEITGNITYSGDGPTTANAIRAALVALPNIGADGCSVTSIGGGEFNVTFANANRADDIGELAPRTIVSEEGLVICVTLTQGKAGGEPIISATRGYPACGAFHQGRLWMGGLRSRPQTLLASRIGQWFNFVSQGTAKAISVDLDTDETTTMQAIYPGQHLQFFTSAAEFFVPIEPISPTPGVKRTTLRGIAVGTPLAEISGATVFITAGGKALAEFLYDENRSTYSAAFLSKWATHALGGLPGAPTRVIDMGFRRAETPTQCDRALLIRDDGDMAVMHALREDEVTGFTRWTTQGLYLAAAADLARDEYIAVQRTFEGEPEIFLEKVDANAMLDCSVTVTGASTRAYVPHLEGRTVALYVDGADAGDALVVGGYAVYPNPALREVNVGLLFSPRMVTLPPVLEQDPRAGSSVAQRAGVIDLELGPTANIKVGLKDGKLFRPPMKRRPFTHNDEGPGENPFQGWTQIIGLTGWRPDVQCEIRQDRPGPLQVNQIVLTIET